MFSYISIAAASFVFGVYLTDACPTLDAPEILALAITIIGVLLLLFKRLRTKLYVLLLFLILGIGGVSAASDFRFNELYPLENKYTAIEGYICDMPEQYGELYSYKLKVCRAEYLGVEYPSDQTIRVSSYEKLGFGDCVRVKGFLERFSDRKNSTEFNVRRYYQSRGIFYKLYAREMQGIQLKINKFSLNYMVNACRSKLSDIIDSYFYGDDSAILKAVSLGNKRQFSPEYKSVLLRTGIMKYFYSPFFHVQFIMLLAELIFSRCRKSTRSYILAGAMVLYAAVNSHSPVFIKVSLTVIFGIIISRKFGFLHKPDLIGLTILAVTLTNPLYCFDVGFIISVSCSIMFYYFFDIICSKLSFLPFGRKFVSFYIITTFVLLPVSAYFFDGIAPYTNLLAPIFSIAAGLLILLIPSMAICITLTKSAAIITKIISGVLVPFAKLPYIVDSMPFSHIYLKPPGLVVLCASFMLLSIIYQFHMGAMRKRRNIILAAICLGLWCSIPIVGIQNIGTMDITFVNVGQGDGAVISIRGGETILIDGGGKYEFSDYDAGENIFLPYLVDNGYTAIDKAIVSHYHSDHVLGIIAAIKNLDVGEIIMPDSDRNNENRLEIERLAQEKGIPIRFISSGDEIKLNSGAVFNTFSPSAEELSLGGNDCSLVLKLSYGSFSCLFTGDIGKQTELEIKDYIGECDVIKMPHHGSANSNSLEFAEAVSAEYAVVSVGEDNIYGFPKEEAIFSYQASGTRIARTDVNGDITVRVEKDGSYRIFRNDI